MKINIFKALRVFDRLSRFLTNTSAEWQDFVDAVADRLEEQPWFHKLPQEQRLLIQERLADVLRAGVSVLRKRLGI